MGTEKDEKALQVQLETLQSLVDSGYELLSHTRPPSYGLDIDLSALLPQASPPASPEAPGGDGDPAKPAP